MQKRNAGCGIRLDAECRRGMREAGGGGGGEGGGGGGEGGGERRPATPGPPLPPSRTQTHVSSLLASHLSTRHPAFLFCILHRVESHHSALHPAFLFRLAPVISSPMRDRGSGHGRPPSAVRRPQF